MKSFTVYFNGEAQPISIEAAHQAEALRIAVASFQPHFGKITVEEDKEILRKSDIAGYIGSHTSEAKARSSAENGKKGGRPRKIK